MSEYIYTFEGECVSSIENKEESIYTSHFGSVINHINGEKFNDESLFRHYNAIKK